MRFLIEKTGGYINLRTLTEFFKATANGCYMVQVTKQHRGRTLAQNDWLWGCVYPVLLDGLLDAGWEFTSLEQVHEFFKKQMAREKVVNYETGEIVEIPHSTATMDTQQFQVYIEALRDYAREFLNVEIPQPDRNWRTNNKH